MVEKYGQMCEMCQEIISIETGIATCGSLCEIDDLDENENLRPQSSTAVAKKNDSPSKHRTFIKTVKEWVAKKDAQEGPEVKEKANGVEVKAREAESNGKAKGPYTKEK